MEQKHQVRHGEGLTYQGQQLPEETWERESESERGERRRESRYNYMGTAYLCKYHELCDVMENPAKKDSAHGKQSNGFTIGLVWANKDVGSMGESLHELGNAFCAALGLAEGTHHSGKDPLNNASEQLRIKVLPSQAASPIP